MLTPSTLAPADCVIRLGAAGREPEDLYPFLTEVTVTRSRTEAGTALLRFTTRRDDRGAWSVQDSALVEPWQPVGIEAAFGARTEEVMRGVVRQVDASYPARAGAAEVVVACQDESLALDREHVRRVWGADAPTTDQAIVTAVVGRHPPLSVHPASASGLTGLVVSQDTTDIRFLRARAEANGYELLVDQGNVYFGPMRLDGSPQPTILVYAGADTSCSTLSVRADGHLPDRVVVHVAPRAGSQVNERVVQPDLPVLGARSADSSGAGLGPFTWSAGADVTGSMDEMVARAQGKANRAALKVRAEGELDGSAYRHVLRVGQPVGVDGVGDRFNGTYYVDRVVHTFSARGYVQAFTLLRNGYGDDLVTAGGGLATLV